MSQPDPKSAAGEASVTTARTGVITEWNEAKGYGFVHIHDFTERPHNPQPGDKVTYTLGTDRQGRTCAQNIDAQLDWRLFHGVRAWVKSLG